MTRTQEVHKSGFIAVCGKPNVGKSTLLNRIIGEKLAAVSPKPQTTRHLIRGILDTDSYQIVFIDLPGIIDPKDRFNKGLMETVRSGLEDSDVLCYMIEPRDPRPVSDEADRIIRSFDGPRILLINKLDTVDYSYNPTEQCLPLDLFNEVLSISALEGYGVEKVLDVLLAHLKEGPKYYDPDDISDRNTRFFVAEIVREKIYLLFGEEIPYAVATQTEEYREERMPVYIRVVIYVEKESQKSIIIGAEGKKIRQIGVAARKDMEKFIGQKVYLDLWVKLKKNWRKKDGALSEFGYLPTKKERLS